MVRTIVTPENTHIELDIPAEYVGKKIEITYHTLDEKVDKPKKNMSDFLAILSNETSAGLMSHVKKSREEWERNI